MLVDCTQVFMQNFSPLPHHHLHTHLPIYATRAMHHALLHIHNTDRDRAHKCDGDNDNDNYDNYEQVLLYDSKKSRPLTSIRWR